MMSKKAGRRPSGTGKASARDYGPADFDERPAKKGRSSRPEPEEYAFLDEESFYEAKKPARAAGGKPSRPVKGRGAALPFEDDGFRKARPLHPVKSGAVYEDRPARKPRFEEDVRPARKARPLDEDYPCAPAAATTRSCRCAKTSGTEAPARGAL